MNGLRIPLSPIAIPAARCGKFSIERVSIMSDALVPLREAFLTGKKAIRVNYDKPRIIHKLVCKGHGVWMTDSLAEVRQAQDAVKAIRPSGRGLVGGLGLGVIAELFMHESGVKSLTVVELAPAVVKLVLPYAKSTYNVVVGDIFQHVKELKTWSYDFAFFDTWQGTSEGTWWTDVMPMRRELANKFGALPKLKFWAEDIMLAQIYSTLTRCQPHWVMKKLAMPMPLADAKWFTANIGLPKWEEKYGTLIGRL